MPGLCYRHDMTLISIEGLAQSLAGDGRCMGLDLGSKTIGVALSDLRRSIATPDRTIQRKKFQADADKLLATIAEHNVVAIVLGLPLNMDGSEGPRCQSTRAFAANLGKRNPLPIVLWDERLSTVAVERVLIDADRSRARRKDLVDKMAAAYILQGALDRLSGLNAAASALPTPPVPHT